MAQHPRGWTLKPHSGTGILHVRFRHAGTRHEITTCTRDAARAAQAAANIYAAVIAGRWRRGTVMVSPSTPIDELAAEWLDEAASGLDPETVKTYLGYVRAHWQPHFGSIGQVNPATLGRYVSVRLGKVVRRTVQKELSALRGFLGWCAESRGVERFEVPTPAKKATGKADARPHKLRAVELSPEQVEAFLDALPELAERGNWPIRARFIVAYETGLRPSTLDSLRVEDFDGTTLRIRDDNDKARFGRELPLTLLAASLLKGLCRDEPLRKLVFGKHDYRAAFAAACEAAGLPHISPYDLRHAFGTHRMESSGGNLPGVAYLMGHKQISTTSKYSHPNQRAARDVLGVEKTPPGANFVGRRFGRLAVTAPAATRGTHKMWRCKCDCGQECSIYQTNLVGGKSTSCGCATKEAAARRRTHGLRDAPEFNVWCNMRRRCNDPKNKSYADYGGRGITVCQRWAESFAAFYEDMGPRPSAFHSIDRINGNLDYESGNCRWATRLEQNRNRRSPGPAIVAFRAAKKARLDALGGQSGAGAVRKAGVEPARVISPLEPERSASGRKRSELFISVSARIAKKRPDTTDMGAAKHLLDALDSAVAGEAEETTASLARAAELLQAGGR